jgi:hypothetical protein
MENYTLVEEVSVAKYRYPWFQKKKEKYLKYY